MDSTTTAAKEISVRPVQESTASPKVKLPPKAGEIPLDFIYFPSDDGTDENLLILLHGLGDTHKPFAKLGRSLKLPQTATLALKAPEQIPYLYEDAFQWYPTFDDLGEFLAQPNPTVGIDALIKTLEYLTDTCSWPASRIHLFGFAQGGTVAGETALRFMGPLASVVSISGPLLSYPTSIKSPTPFLLFHRAELVGAGTPLKKGFSDFREVKVAGGEGMPRSKDEWETIMKFWSERLQRRVTSEGGGLYEVLTGA